MDSEKKPLGFAVLKKRDPKRLGEICSMGGKAAKNRHRFTHEEAVQYGQIGGRVSRRRGKSTNKQ